MSESLSREQLLDYIKKQKLKIKKLESKTSELSGELEALRNKKVNGSTSQDKSRSEDERVSTLEAEVNAKKMDMMEMQASHEKKISC